MAAVAEHDGVTWRSVYPALRITGRADLGAVMADWRLLCGELVSRLDREGRLSALFRSTFVAGDQG